jgi:hypothetical protein
VPITDSPTSTSPTAHTSVEEAAGTLNRLLPTPRSLGFGLGTIAHETPSQRWISVRPLNEASSVEPTVHASFGECTLTPLNTLSFPSTSGLFTTFRLGPVPVHGQRVT